MDRKPVVTTIGVAVLAAFVAAAAPVLAGQADETASQAQPPAQARSAEKAVLAAPAPRRAQGLALTEDQKTKIRALREQQQAETKTAREALRAARQKLAGARKAEAFDENAIRAAAGAVATAQTEVMVQQARHRAQYLGLLTPDQRERAKALRERAARAQGRARGSMGQPWDAWGRGPRGNRMGWGPGQNWGRGPGWDPGLGWGPTQGWGRNQGRAWMRGQGWGPGWWGPNMMGPAMRGPRPPRPPAPDAPKTPAAPPAPPAPKK